jgi:hypothetical protein
METGEVRTEFLVHWLEYKERTWEPMDTLCVKCPLLFEKFQNDSHKKILKRQSKALGKSLNPDSTPKVPQMSQKFLNSFKNEAESIPKGTETVEDISAEIRGPDSVKLWIVTFVGRPGPLFIRKSVMEYYFPFDAALFNKYLVSKQKN